MIQSRRERIYSVDAKLYLFNEYAPLLNDLKDVLEEETTDYETMPEGLQDSNRGTESRDAQACLQRAIKALSKVVEGKKKAQELMDEVHENLRMV